MFGRIRVARTLVNIHQETVSKQQRQGKKARVLVILGLGLSQMAMMREPIHNAVAQVFLVKFLQGLAEYIRMCRILY